MLEKRKVKEKAAQKEVRNYFMCVPAFFVVVAILHSYSSTTQIGVLIIIECNHVVNLLLLR